LLIIAAGNLSVTQFAIGKGLHGDSYPFPPGGLSQASCTVEGSTHLDNLKSQRNSYAQGLGTNPFK
jgi:hypothetical protein